MVAALSFLLCLMGLPAFAEVPDIDAPGISRAIEVQEAHTEALMVKRGVMGTGVGYNAAGEPAIKVFVQTQADVAGFPQTLDGISVEVVVTGMFIARHHRPGHSGGPSGGGDPEPTADCESSPSDPTALCDRPVPIGVSTGHPDVTAGTIGARVKDSSGYVYALSNNHVYANINDAFIGDAVIQPGAFDGGISPADDIGTLHDFKLIDFTGANNDMDAAIAFSNTGLLGNSTPPDGYGTPSATIADAIIGLPVQKFGRTTGLTSGEVDTINSIVDICYQSRGPFICTKSARYIGQIIITPGDFSAGGDSGSLIVTETGNNPVALLFAGSSTHTIASPIGPVLTRFGVTVDGSTP